MTLESGDIMAKIINLSDGWRILKDRIANGRNKKYWFENKRTGNTALFKYPTRQENGRILKDYVSEVLSSRVAQLINIQCAKTEFATYNGEIGVLSHNVLEENEILIDGAVLLEREKFKRNSEEKYSTGSVLNSLKMFALKGNKDMANEARRHFNENYSIDMVLASLREFGLEKEFVKTVFFDALIGNNDRNQSNYGIIYNEKEKSYKMCPLYDNGSSLSISKLDEISNHIATLKSNSHLDKEKLSRATDKKISNITQNSPSKIELPGRNNVNHFDIVEFVTKRFPVESERAMRIIERSVTKDRLTEEFSDVNGQILSEEEKKLLIDVLINRKDKLLELYKKIEKVANKELSYKPKETDLCLTF